MARLIPLPISKLSVIWKRCWLENPKERVKLNQLESVISARPRKKSAKQGLMVQLTQEEVHYIQNIYERVF